MNNLAQCWSWKRRPDTARPRLSDGKPLQCLKHSMVGRVELGFGSLIFQCSMFRSGVNARALGELQKRLELTITTSSRSHSHARSLSQFSIPSLAVALVHVLFFFPNRKCSMSSAFSCCSDATLPPTPRANYQQWRRVTEHGWPA